MGQAGGQVANDAHTGSVRVNQIDKYRRHGRDDQCRGYARCEIAQRQHGGEAEQTGQDRRKRCLR